MDLSRSNWRLGLGDRVLDRHRLLLGLRVLLVRAEQLDLSSLELRRYRLGVGLEQVQRLAILLYIEYAKVSKVDRSKMYQ